MSAAGSTPLRFALMRMIHEAEAESMKAILDGWDKEIARTQLALEEAAKKAAVDAVEKAAHDRAELSKELQARIGQDRLDRSASNDQASAASIESLLRGLVANAEAGADVTISIPSGIRVASTMGGTSASELSALATEVFHADEEPTARSDGQRSALWAVTHGFMPHPVDVATVMTAVGRDPSYSGRLNELGRVLDAIPQGRVGPLKFRALAATQRLERLSELRQLLSSYGPRRLLTLLARPFDLHEDAPDAPAFGAQPQMGHEGLGQVLDALFPRTHR